MTFLPLRWRSPDLFRDIDTSIRELQPWYQPIWFTWGLKTNPQTKDGHKISLFSLDRGLAKWWYFIKPNLPFSLKGRRVMDVGCNAGLFLIKSIDQGAEEAIGIEIDDHYHAQAEFVIKTISLIRQKPVPIKLYQCPVENFDFSRVDGIDITFFLNSIYHVGKVKGEFIYSPDDIHMKQVETLRKVGTRSEYILFQANSLEDEGRGKGRGSLLKLIHDAGLIVHSEKTYDHARGYILVVRKKH
ncbi:MAG TPA: DUF1698 domain-containing protein [Elusimicrobiota bacterium]|nr:DUF1698 domain-containing protein [Elusimicrobiota bacterium]